MLDDCYEWVERGGETYYSFSTTQILLLIEHGHGCAAAIQLRSCAIRRGRTWSCPKESHFGSSKAATAR